MRKTPVPFWFLPEPPKPRKTPQPAFIQEPPPKPRKRPGPRPEEGITYERRSKRLTWSEQQDFETLRMNTKAWQILLQQRESAFQRVIYERAVRDCRRILGSLSEPEPFSELEQIPCPSLVIPHGNSLRPRRRS